MIVSAIQFCPRLASSPADVRDNFRRVGPMLASAARGGADLIVLPELCLTGCTFLSEEEAARVAEPVDGWTFRAFREVAMASDSYVAFGMVEDGGDSLHNTAVVVSPDGDPVIVSRKSHGAGCDYLWARMSEEPAPVADTRLGAMSAVVCRDLKNEMPGSAEADAFGGVRTDVVAGLTNWGKGFWPPSTWMDFSKDNGCLLVVANRWGREQRRGAYGSFASDFGQGGSAVIEPGGKVHTGGLRFSENCVVTARVEARR